MQAVAEQTGSVISAALFGALAASAALPFPRIAFEATIRAVGVGVDSSLRAFAAGHDAVFAPPEAPPAPQPPQAIRGPAPGLTRFREAESRLADFPEPAREMLGHGIRRLAD